MKPIVICCDGTSNGIAGDPTNVLRFYRSLAKDSQLTYYDSGVGTLPDPSMMTDPGKALGKTLDKAVGFSVRNQVCGAYRFLARHWEPGDPIYLLGFSRGAYAVRALAGMLHAVGLLPADMEHLAELGWSVYAAADFLACSNFRHAFSREANVAIHFVGVWDTVSSFGRMTNFKTLPYTANNPSIAHVRHAVAIHEKRVCFMANLFRPKDRGQHDSFKEVWFKGAHGDVGGGYPEKESGLAKVTLEWMYDEARGVGCSLDDRQVDFYLGRTSSKTFQCTPDSSQPFHNSMKGFWHVLEFLPRKQWSHSVEPERMTWHFPNLYRARKIPKDAVFYEASGRGESPNPDAI